MPFPSTLSTFNRPVSTDRLNSPSHSALHNTVSSALGQVEAVIGVEGNNSVVGTLEYLIKSPGSDGGGHIQTPTKGGTGLTSYTKGDILIATATNTLSKLAVGSAGEVLQVGGNATLGWGSVLANKIATTTPSVFSTDTTATPIFATSILGSTIGTNNAIRFTGIIQKFDTGNTLSLSVNYGNNTILTIPDFPGGSVIGGKAIVQGMIVGNGASSQLGYMTLKGDVATAPNPFNLRGTAVGKQFFHVTATGSSSINTFANQNLLVVSSFATAGNSILSGAFVVERIQ